MNINKHTSYYSALMGIGLLMTTSFTQNVNALCPPPQTPESLLDTNIVKLNLQRVPTGILEDFGKTPINLYAFDGVSALVDSNYVNFRTLNGILAGLSSSRVSADVQIPSDISGQMSQLSGNGVNPVGIVAYKYNRTSELAVANHLLSVVDNQYYDAYDAGGNWLNPYEDRYVVAFSPYFNVAGGQVTYSFRTGLLFSNLSITSILFNAGDGQGYREIGLGNRDIHVTYPNPTNPVELKLKIFLANGAMLETHSYVNVLFSPSPSSSTVIPDSEQTFTCDSVYLGYTSPVQAVMSIKYASGHSNLIKPFIIAEGFDPLSDPNGIIPGSIAGKGLNSIRNLDGGICEECSNCGYDIVYIDWLNSCAPIQANANILKQVINWVNTNKTGIEKNIVIGQSMGGLIARYALRTMELAGVPHDVKTYVSDDAPHYGVNVPAGYLYALQSLLESLEFVNSSFWGDLISFIVKSVSGTQINANTYITEVFNLRDAPSVRQMLMHYVTTNGMYDSQMYNTFQSVFNELEFPQGDAGQGIKNLAISNGGTNTFSDNLDYHLHLDAGVYNGIFGPLYGPFLGVLFNDVVAGVLSSIVLFSGPRIQFNVYPNYSGTQTVFNYSLSWEKYGGLFQGNVITLRSDSFNAPSTSLVYDSDAGSYYKIQRASIDTTFSGGNVLTGGYEVDAYLNNRFMFVPSVSSLAYKKKRYNLVPSDRTINFMATGIDMDKIPFDGYKFVSDTSTYHTVLTNDEIEWIDKMAPLSINVPTNPVLSGYSFSLNDLTMPVTWTVADNTVATIDSSTGVITKVLGGASTVYADISYNGGHLRLSKNFYIEEVSFPGFPSFLLSQEAAPSFGSNYNGEYTVRAKELASVDDMFKPFMTCHWGVKEDSNSPIEWTTQPYSPFHHWLDFFCYFPSTASARRVYFYVSYQNQVSPTYSVFCRVPPSQFVLDGDGNLYTEDLDNPFAQVKSETEEEVFYFTCVDKSLVYTHWPTWAEFGRDMLESEEFVAQIKTLKPWGEESVVLIPYSYHSSIQETEEHDVITVRFDETL